MASKKTSAVATLLAPREVGLNRDTNLLKLIAMACMLCDHVGKMFFPQYQIMRVIGRLAFPLYAYCMGVGCVYSSNMLKYLRRILLVGLISQPFYAVALAHKTRLMYAVSFAENPFRAVMNFYVESWAVPNIMYTLALGLMLIWSLRERRYVYVATIALFVWRAQATINYGWRGVLLIALFYLTLRHWWVSLPVMLSYMFWWGLEGSSFHAFGLSFGVQMFAILALPLIYIPTWSNLKINKWVFYLFYPAHLIGIMLIQFALALGK